MTHPTPPQWRLPSGVTRGLWDYGHCPNIAESYDDYFAENRLFELDQQVVLKHLRACGISRGELVADLGCGTARILVSLARHGYRGLAVDLSPRMLSIVRDKAVEKDLPIECLQANLVQLDALADHCVSAAVCLFSTLGMIRGGEHRQQCLNHFRRILKPGGPLVLHVHNYWYTLRDPGGPWWILSNTLRSALVGDIERGDKYFTYRGVPNMFLHVFTQRELKICLRRAGFRIREVIPLNPRRTGALRWPWLGGQLRANGWIVAAE